MNSTKLFEKNLDLSFDFHKYLFKHLHLLNKIPDGATIFFTVSGDEAYNQSSRALMKRTRGRKKVVEARKVGRTWKIQPVADRR